MAPLLDLYQNASGNVRIPLKSIKKPLHEWKWLVIGIIFQKNIHESYVSLPFASIT